MFLKAERLRVWKAGFGVQVASEEALPLKFIVILHSPSVRLTMCCKHWQVKQTSLKLKPGASMCPTNHYPEICLLLSTLDMSCSASITPIQRKPPKTLQNQDAPTGGSPTLATEPPVSAEMCPAPCHCPFQPESIKVYVVYINECVYIYIWK